MIAIVDAEQSTYRGLRAGDWVLIDACCAEPAARDRRGHLA
jgi:hypothetical protein